MDMHTRNIATWATSKGVTHLSLACSQPQTQHMATVIRVPMRVWKRLANHAKQQQEDQDQHTSPERSHLAPQPVPKQGVVAHELQLLSQRPRF